VSDALQSPSSHTTPDPSAPNGPPNGPALPRVAPPTLAAAEAPPGANKAPTGPPGAPRPVLDGEPDTLPLTYCRKCQVEVMPQGKGRCPRCQTFLRLNFSARKHPVNLLRRDALLAELVSEFSPATIVERSACEHLAAAYERLDSMRPGSPEWSRLVTVAQTLSATLQEARLSHEARTPIHPGTNNMPTPALTLAHTLLTHLAAGKTLTEFERGQLDVLRGAMRGELVLAELPDGDGEI